MNKVELKDNISIIYNEENISINKNDITKVICNERCSNLSFNENRNKFVYLSSLEWEEIAKLNLYDVENDSLKQVEIINIQNQYTIKQVQWIHDDKLIMIVGFAYGTVTVGGDIYTYDLVSNEFKIVYQSLEQEEVKRFTLRNNILELEIVHFNDNYNGYKIRNDIMKIDF